MWSVKNKLFAILFFTLYITEFEASATPQKTVRVAIGKAMKPYVLNQQHGIIIDLIRKSFSIRNHNVEFIFYSNEKALRAFQKNSVDAVAVVKPTMVNAWLSNSFISYHNHVVSLARANLPITQVSDLSHYKVMAFSHAHIYLGNTFYQAISHNTQYEEVVDQFAQVKALFDGETDVIVLDKTIFTFYWKQLRHKYPSNSAYRQDTKLLPLFQPSDYRVAFNTKELQVEFNEGFAELKSLGQVQKIYQKYTRLLRSY